MLARAQRLLLGRGAVRRGTGVLVELRAILLARLGADAAPMQPATGWGIVMRLRWIAVGVWIAMAVLALSVGITLLLLLVGCAETTTYSGGGHLLMRTDGRAPLCCSVQGSACKWTGERWIERCAGE